MRTLLIDLSPAWGGAQASLCDWLEAAPRAFRKKAVAIAGCEQLQRRLKALGIESNQVSIGRWRATVPGVIVCGMDAFRLRPYILAGSNRADAIYVNGYMSAIPLLACPKSRLPPITVHLRDVRGSRLAHRLIAGSAKNLIAISPFQAGMLKPGLGSAAARVTIIPNGVAVPPAADRATVRRRLDLPEEAPVVVLPADFISWKRHERLLGAVALLPGWHAVVCGGTRDGRGDKLRHDLECLCRSLRIGHRVRFPGRLPAGDFLAAADVLVSAADDEPFGRTVVEAMHAGIPVVASTRGGPADLLTGYPGAVFCDTQDPRAFATAIQAASRLQPQAITDKWVPETCANAILNLLKVTVK